MTAAIVAEIRASKKPYYVYVLSRPDGTPFYAGMGSGLRVLRHEGYARATDQKTHLLNTIRKIWVAGGKVGRRIESWHDSRAEAAKREVELIAIIGRRDLGTGPLVNQTTGGDGGRKLGPAARKARSEWMKKRIQEDPSLRERLGEVRRRFNQENPLLEAAHAAARVEAVRRPEVREAIRQTKLAQKEADPEFAEKCRQRSTLAATPQVLTKISEGNRRWVKENPELAADRHRKSAEARLRRTMIRERCQQKLAALGLAMPDGRATIGEWLAFEARLDALAGK